MALHGDLRVNGHSIGSWEAVQQGETTPGVYTYRTQVTLNGQTFKSTVDHRYTDGAAVLASKVLTTANTPDQALQPPVGHHA